MVVPRKSLSTDWILSTPMDLTQCGFQTHLTSWIQLEVPLGHDQKRHLEALLFSEVLWDALLAGLLRHEEVVHSLPTSQKACWKSLKKPAGNLRKKTVGVFWQAFWDARTLHTWRFCLWILASAGVLGTGPLWMPRADCSVTWKIVVIPMKYGGQFPPKRRFLNIP